jgi:hypothetical protein
LHTITALHQGLRVYWYEHSENGGSALTSYDVEYRSLGAELLTHAGHTGTSQPAVIAGLRFDTPYEVRVRARNANGAGAWSTVEARRSSRDWPGDCACVRTNEGTADGSDTTNWSVSPIRRKGSARWTAYASLRSSRCSRLSRSALSAPFSLKTP